MNYPRGTKSRSDFKRGLAAAALKPAKTPPARTRLGAGGWFVGMGASIALLLLIAGFATGRAWRAVEMVVALSIPLAILWAMIAPRHPELAPLRRKSP